MDPECRGLLVAAQKQDCPESPGGKSRVGCSVMDGGLGWTAGFQARHLPKGSSKMAGLEAHRPEEAHRPVSELSSRSPERILTDLLHLPLLLEVLQRRPRRAFEEGAEFRARSQVDFLGDVSHRPRLAAQDLEHFVHAGATMGEVSVDEIARFGARQSMGGKENPHGQVADALQRAQVRREMPARRADVDDERVPAGALNENFT